MSRITTHDMLKASSTASRLMLFAALALLPALAGGGCGSNSGTPAHPEPLTIAVSAWPADTPIHVAIEKGFFKDEGLAVKLKMVASGHLGLEAALAGEADLCTVSESPIARAALDGRPVAVVASICKIEQPLHIIARKDRGILSVEDLKGRSIGIVEGSVAKFFTHLLLIVSYVDPHDVRLKGIAPDRQVEALLAGEVDAVATWAPHSTVLRNRLGGNATVLGDPTIYTMIWNIAGARPFVEARRNTIERLLRALIRANEFMARNPGEARAISARRIGVAADLFAGEWDNYRFDVVLDQGLLLDLEEQARWMREEDGEEAHPIPNFLEMVSSDALKAVRPESVTITGR